MWWTMAWTVVRDALLVLAGAPVVYYLLAIIAARRFFSGRSAKSPPPSDFDPPVSILKPIRGLDRETYENYASFCNQDYPEFEILFCVSDESDPAVPIIEKLIRDFPRRAIRLLIGAEKIGASDKVNKLCRMVRQARHEIVIVSDSDVRVEQGFLRAVVPPLADPRVGGVTCLYRGLTDGGFAADLEALGNSADFAPGVLVARLFGGLNFMLGAVMATSKKHLGQIGGFESLADYFCDDYELGNRIAARGYRVELSRFPVAISYPHETIGDAVRHQLRWNLSIRYSRPWGHFGLLFAQGLPWAIVAAIVAPSGLLAVCYLAAYFGCRTAMAIAVAVGGMKDRGALGKLWMLVPRDAFAFVVWMASFFPQRIHWRDREFLVREKRLVPVPPRNSP
jgi:ceramide glucosyltransferase